MKKNLLLLLLIFTMYYLQAQNIAPAGSVNVGSTVTYTFSNGSSYSNINWAAGSYGTVESKWNSGTTYYATIHWTTLGTASLTVLDQNYVGRGNLSVTINLGTPNTTFWSTPVCTATATTIYTHQAHQQEWIGTGRLLAEV